LEERLNYELDVINRMGYAGYFLIVQDFIEFAHKMEFGSVPAEVRRPGSIVSYCLGITNLDPIEYGLSI